MSGSWINARWLKVAASVGLLALTATVVDLSGLMARLASIQMLPVLVALAVSVPQLAITAWRWHFTAGRMDLPLPFVVAWREYYVSTLLNSVLPGGVLGDASRVVRLSAQSPDFAGKVARCVVIERASGQIALWLIIAVGVVAWGVTGPIAVAPWLLAGGVAVLALVMLALRSSVVARSRFGAGIRTAGAELRSAMVSRGAWAVQLAASVAAVGLLGAMFYLCIVAVGAPVSAAQALLIAPLVLAASALPISVGGWGVREATAAGLFELMGLSAVSGAAASAAFGAVSLLSAAPGAVLLLRAPRLEAAS
ncbi:MAG: flippase-like domain-containing protein [Nannocystaceae bacterium]|nr:flippase-like domain-containing protein [Nannocystaceae bacterium]